MIISYLVGGIRKYQNINLWKLGRVCFTSYINLCASLDQFVGRHYTIIDFNEVYMRIYLPQKVIFTEATRPR